MVFKPAYPPQESNAVCPFCEMPVKLLKLTKKYRVLNTCGSGHVHTCAATLPGEKWEKRTYRDKKDEQMMTKVILERGGDKI